MFARHVGIEIFAEGKDVTEDLSTYIQTFSYVDNSGGTADTAEIEVRDDEHKFIGDWLPKKGITVSITLVKEFWRDESTETLPLGDWAMKLFIKI